MSLNNVYRWNKDGWQKIIAEEFVKDNPNIKISAKDEYFWCEMCGQYVTLANEKRYAAYLLEQEALKIFETEVLGSN